jgi:hypothetical protein
MANSALTITLPTTPVPVSQGGTAASSSTADSTATALPWDNTVPQNTEGKEYLTTTITPTSSTSTLIIDIYIPAIACSVGSGTWVGAIFQDSTASALTAAGFTIPSGHTTVFTMRYYMTSGTTSSTTFKFRYGPDSGTAYITQASGGNAKFGGVYKATMTVTEYA